MRKLLNTQRQVSSRHDRSPRRPSRATVNGLGTMVVLSLLALSGCRSFSAVNITDMGPYPGESSGSSNFKCSSRGDTLIVEVENRGPAKVVAMDPIVYGGDIYLETVAISGAGPTRFEIDIAPLGLGPDWTEHVYLFGGSWDNGILAFGHRGPLPQHTQRWKLEVKPKEGPTR